MNSFLKRPSPSFIHGACPEFEPLRKSREDIDAHLRAVSQLQTKLSTKPTVSPYFERARRTPENAYEPRSSLRTRASSQLENKASTMTNFNQREPNQTGQSFFPKTSTQLSSEYQNPVVYGKKSFLQSDAFKNSVRRHHPEVSDFPQTNRSQADVAAGQTISVEGESCQCFEQEKAKRTSPSKMYAQFNQNVLYTEKPDFWNKEKLFLDKRRACTQRDKPMATTTVFWGNHDQKKSQISDSDLSRKYQLGQVKEKLQNFEIAKFRNPLNPNQQSDPQPSVSQTKPLIHLKKFDDFQFDESPIKDSKFIVRKKSLPQPKQIKILPKINSVQISHQLGTNARIPNISRVAQAELIRTNDSTDSVLKPSVLLESDCFQDSVYTSHLGEIPMHEFGREKKNHIVKHFESQRMQHKTPFALTTSIQISMVKRELDYAKRKPKRVESLEYEAAALKSRLERSSALDYQDSMLQTSLMEPESDRSNAHTQRTRRKEISRLQQHKFKKGIVSNALARCTLPRCNNLSDRSTNLKFEVQMNNLSSRAPCTDTKDRISQIYSDYHRELTKLPSPQKIERERNSSTDSDRSLDSAQVLDGLDITKAADEKKMKNMVRSLIHMVERHKVRVKARKDRDESRALIDSIDITKIQEKIFQEQLMFSKQNEFLDKDFNASALQTEADFKRIKLKMETLKDMRYKDFKIYIKYLEDDPFTKQLARFYEDLRFKMRQKRNAKIIETPMDAALLSPSYAQSLESEEEESESDAESQRSNEIRHRRKTTVSFVHQKPVALNNQKNFSHLFEDYLAKKEAQKKECSSDFYDKYENHLVSQISNLNSALGTDVASAKMTFLQSIKKSLDLSLPVLSKISNQVLGLTDYHISLSHAQALSSVFMYFPNIVTKLHLENCGLNDESLAELTRGGRNLKLLSEVVIKHQPIGCESIQQLHKLFGRPGKLEVLKLISCKVNAKASEDLLIRLKKQSALKVLSLVDFSFTEQSFLMLINFLEENLWIEELDLSYARGLGPKSFIPFFQALAKNTKLRSLNLSWCNFIEDQTLAKMKAEAPTKLLEEMKRQEEIRKKQFIRKAAEVVKRRELLKTKKLQQRVEEGPLLDLQGKRLCEIPMFPHPGIDLELRYQSPRPHSASPVKSPGGKGVFFSNKRTSIYKEDRKSMQVRAGADVRVKSPSTLRKQTTQNSFSLKKQSTIQSIIPQPPSDEEKEEEISDAALIAIEGLYKFIRRNSALQHLDLTHCNLSQVMIARIALAAKCSPSIAAIHFSDNPGVTPVLKEFLRIRLKCIVPEISNFAREMLKTGKLSQKDPKKLSSILAQQLKDPEGDEREEKSSESDMSDNPHKISNSLANESIALRYLNRRINQISGLNNMPVDVDAVTRHLLLTRVLNHKEIIPGSGQWRILTQQNQECWLCHRYIFTYLFWNPLSIANSKINREVINIADISESLKAIDQWDYKTRLKNHQEAVELKEKKAYAMEAAKIRMKIFSNDIDKKTGELTKVEQSAEFSFVRPESVENFDYQRFEEGKTDIPFIYGQFTDWRPQKMMTIEELTNKFRPTETVDFVQIFRDRYNLSQNLKTEADLDEFQKVQLELLKQEYEKDFRINWRKIITSKLFFKQPQFLNYEVFREEDDMLDQLKFFNGFSTFIEAEPIRQIPLYVLPCMMKPGLNYYVVKQLSKVEDMSCSISCSSESSVDLDNPSKVAKGPPVKPVFYVHKGISQIREERVPVFKKKFMNIQTQRHFYKRTSVWAPWRLDTNSTIKNCVKSDLPQMRLEKLIRDSEMMTAFTKIVERYYPEIKEIHAILLGATDQFPYVTWLDFVNICEEWKLYDENVNQTKLDLLFMQVASYNRSKTGLNRGEFIELLLRVAKMKYYDSGKTKTVDEALKKLITQSIKPNMKLGRMQQYRQDTFWNNEVNDILQANLVSLKKIYKMYENPESPGMTIDDAVYLLTAQMIDMKIPVKIARQCYALSQMTIVDDATKPQLYNRLEFVEFLELICRGTMVYFAGLDKKIEMEKTLEQKIEFMVDQVLMIKSLPRKEVVIETQIDSEADVTDDDY